MAASARNMFEDEIPDSSSQNKELKEGATKPTCVLVLGMAGSGKTTFVQVVILSESRIFSITLVQRNDSAIALALSCIRHYYYFFVLGPSD